MSNDLDEFLSEAESKDGSQESGTQLRTKLEKAYALLKQQGQELDALKTEKAERAVVGTWNELGVPDAIRKFYTGDKTADAIKSWWEDSKGFFNVQEGEQQAAPVVTPEDQAKQAAIQAAQQASVIGTDLNDRGFDGKLAKLAEIKGIADTGQRKAALAEFYAVNNVPEF